MIGLNSKEANSEALAEAAIDALPRFLIKEGVVAMSDSNMTSGPHSKTKHSAVRQVSVPAAT